MFSNGLIRGNTEAASTSLRNFDEQIVGVAMRTDDAHRVRPTLASFLREACSLDGFIDGFFRHSPIRRPFATCHCHHPIFFDRDDVISGHVFCILRAGVGCEGTNTAPRAQYVRTTSINLQVRRN